MVKRTSTYYARMKHTQRRAMERAAIELTDEMYESLNKEIQENTDLVEFLFKVSSSKSVFKVSIDNSDYYCIYSKTTNCIITILQKKWIKTDEDGNLYVQSPKRRKTRKKKGKQNGTGRSRKKSREFRKKKIKTTETKVCEDYEI